MPKKDYPTPCLKRGPDGESFVFETPSGHTIPVGTELEAREYVFARKLHRKFGRVFIETGPKRFATLLADDGGDEDESSIED